MTDMDWLMYASVAVWIGLGGYVTFIAFMQKNLNRRLERLEDLRDDSECE